MLFSIFLKKNLNKNCVLSNMLTTLKFSVIMKTWYKWSFRLLHHVVFWRCTNVSGDHTASIITLALMMEAVQFSEMLVHSQNTTQYNNPDHWHSHHCENLKFYLKDSWWQKANMYQDGMLYILSFTKFSSLIPIKLMSVVELGDRWRHTCNSLSSEEEFRFQNPKRSLALDLILCKLNPINITSNVKNIFYYYFNCEF
jgi:hypothetical protein